jgi:hypothetical protein
VRLSHTVARTSVAFDDPNLVSHAGLVMTLAARAARRGRRLRPPGRRLAGRTRTSRSAAWPPDVTQRVKTEEARDAMFTYEY